MQFRLMFKLLDYDSLFHLKDVFLTSFYDGKYEYAQYPVE